MEDNAVWSEKYKSDRLLSKRNDRFCTYKYQNAPDEADNFPERKVCVNREIADN